MSNPARITIEEAAREFLDTVALSRSYNTARTYNNALLVFAYVLEENDLPPEETPATALSEDAIGWFITFLKDYAASSEQAYIVAVSRFFQYLAAEELADINLQRLQLLIRTRARRPGQRLPQFPREAIEKIVDYAATLPNLPFDKEAEQLRNYRDRAFILTLADTGLRVHEACGLRRGDFDWSEHKAIIIGKGDLEAVIRFSSRAMRAIKSYLSLRSSRDSAFGRPLSSLPVFARHDRGAGKKIKPISTATGRNIVRERVHEALGEEADGSVTPHSFRHYFVTTILRASGGNLKLAQELARHKNIQTTQRYAHLSDDELDKGYHEIFEKQPGRKTAG